MEKVRGRIKRVREKWIVCPVSGSDEMHHSQRLKM